MISGEIKKYLGHPCKGNCRKNGFLAPGISIMMSPREGNLITE